MPPNNDGPYEPDRVPESAANIVEFVRGNAETLYRLLGICRMGMDDAAAVDAERRVRDTVGLRVADASVTPAIARGNTNAPNLISAEKAADLVRRSEPARF